jgi:NTE family protein
MPTRTALVISGGGAKGAFAVGVVKYIYEKFRDTGWFAITGGTSTGALISPLAAMMAAPEPMGKEAHDTLVHLYSNVSTPNILESQSLIELIQRQDCLNETDPLNELLHRYFRPEWFEWLQTPEAPTCYVVYTNFQTGQKAAVSPKDAGMTMEGFLQAMMASASIPVLMEATLINEQVCYDGGVRDLLPFGAAIKLGAERILPVFLDPEDFPRTPNRFRRMDKILMRTLEILVDEAGRNDFDMANLINIGIQAKHEILDAAPSDKVRKKLEAILAKPAYQDLFGPEKRVIEIVPGLRPTQRLTENSLDFVPAEMRLWVEWGAEKAATIIQQSPFL